MVQHGGAALATTSALLSALLGRAGTTPPSGPPTCFLAEISLRFFPCRNTILVGCETLWLMHVQVSRSHFFPPGAIRVQGYLIYKQTHSPRTLP